MLRDWELFDGANVLSTAGYTVHSASVGQAHWTAENLNLGKKLLTEIPDTLLIPEEEESSKKPMG